MAGPRVAGPNRGLAWRRFPIGDSFPIRVWPCVVNSDPSNRWLTPTWLERETTGGCRDLPATDRIDIGWG